MATRNTKATGTKKTTAEQRVDALDELRADGIQNLMLGIGATDDKTKATRATYRAQTPTQIDTLIAGDDMAHNVAWIPAEEMTRAWIDLQGERGGEIERVLNAIDARTVLTEALAWERAFGGALVVVGLDKQPMVKAQSGIDTADVDYSQPLVPGGDLKWLHCFDRNEVTVTLDAFGDPAFYDVALTNRGTRTRIHHTRCLRFAGTPLPRRLRLQDGWGQSIFDRIAERILSLNVGTAGVAAGLTDFDVAVLKLDRFIELMAGDKQGINRKRLNSIQTMKSVFRLLTLDKNDDFSNVARNFGSVPDLIDRLAERVASAARMPVSLLMGRAPAGLNATGDTDVRNWYAHVESEQETKLRGPLQYLIWLIAQSKKIPDDAVPTLSFRPLWTPTESERATTNLTQAQADQIYFMMGDLSAEEILRSRFSETGYSVETHIDWKARDEEADDGDGVDLSADDEIVPTASGASATDVQKTALNGAQLQAASAIIADVVAKKIPRDSGVQLLVLGFQLTTAEAEQLMGTAGGSFVPAVDPTTPMPPSNA